MAELVRVIEKQDIPRVGEILKIVFGGDNYSGIVRLGGMTNHSYKVVLENGETFLVRIPGEGTEELINRSDERKSTELACKLNIDSELLYFGDDGTKVMRFIDNPKPMNELVMRQKNIIAQAAEIFRKLHKCGVDTGVRFEVFEMADTYEKIIRNNNVKLYDDYMEIKTTIMGIKKAIDITQESQRVPCHNDSLVDNWVLDGNDRLYLIDWEYSGMNEPMWDLSCLSIEANYTLKEDNELLKAYYGRNVTVDEKKRFIAAKLYVDYLWTLWGLTRVPYDGEFMQEYADNRYKRLKDNILYFNNIEEMNI